MNAAVIERSDRVVGHGDILVVGYGNALRGDDGVGVEVVRRLDSQHLAWIRTEACHQLMPEMVGWVAGADVVVFVDASVGRGTSRVPGEMGGVTVRAMYPGIAGTSASWTAHRCSPDGLLDLACAVFGCHPKGWLIEVPAGQFKWGATLSESAEAGAESAVQVIRGLWEAQMAEWERNGAVRS